MIPPPPGPTVARPVRANQGERFRYQRAMLALIDEMHANVLYWLAEEYQDNPPLMAADALPSREIQKKFQLLAKRWSRRFERAAPDIAKAYLDGSFKASDSAMRQALKDVGFAVEFKLTPAMKDAMLASLNVNVGLINSIPQRYLQQVEGVISRAYSRGRNLEQMVASIRRIYPVTQNRAVIIARDQSNKANAVVVQARQLELGIKEAVWKHSHGGKTPRPSHQRADGTVFDVAKGCLIDEELIQPGELINCRCVGRSVIPGLRKIA